jgi:hypothetical protein
LHGQSSLQHADTALSEFSQLLKDEEQSITSRRGLLPESDLQEFIMFVSSASREKYDTFLEQIRCWCWDGCELILCRELHEKEKESLSFLGSIQSEFVSRRKGRGITPGSTALLDGQMAMNKLLRNFVKLMQTVLETSGSPISDCGQVYRDTHVVKPDYKQQMFDIPPEQESFDHAVFWKDERHSWV